MLQITGDVFSGRPNPSWVIEDEGKARSFLREAVSLRNALGAQNSEANGQLGFRGLAIEPMADDLARDFDLSGPLLLPATLAAAQGAQAEGRNLIERLILEMPRSAAAAEATEEMGEPAKGMQEFLLNLLSTGSRKTVQEEAGQSAAAAEIIAQAACSYELGAYNPGFWNNDATTRQRNNCYNYASNKRTNTFAQPGRGCGAIYRAFNCAELTRASLCDGLHHRYVCFPDSERPRYLVALVIWPGQDFHWYRLNSEGFWSHKPGSTPVRNTDNSNRVITNPETCNRGPYTNFCGYFYTCRTQRIS